MIRLQFIFIALAVFVYLLTGLFGRHTRRQRLIFALVTYATLLVAVAALVLVTGEGLSGAGHY